MISINLLPEELRPQPRSPLPYLMTLVLAVVVVLYCTISFVRLYSDKSTLETRVKDFDIQIEEVRESVEAVKELEKKKKQLNAKEEAIGTITSHLTIWSKVLYDLAGLVPDDVWLSSLKEDVKTTKTTVPNPDPNATEKTITKTSETRKLIVGGYAMSPRAETGVKLVGQLVQAMEDDVEFSQRFHTPTPQSVIDDEFDGVSVKRFEIEAKIGFGGSPE